MANFLKWLFLGLGWAVGGPIGGILGYYLGKAISPDRPQIDDGDASAGQAFSESGYRRGPYRNTGTQQDINVALMVLIAAVMKADGQVKRSELD